MWSWQVGAILNIDNLFTNALHISIVLGKFCEFCARKKLHGHVSDGRTPVIGVSIWLAKIYETKITLTYTSMAGENVPRA